MSDPQFCMPFIGLRFNHSTWATVRLGRYDQRDTDHSVQSGSRPDPCPKPPAQDDQGTFISGVGQEFAQEQMRSPLSAWFACRCAARGFRRAHTQVIDTDFQFTPLGIRRIKLPRTLISITATSGFVAGRTAFHCQLRALWHRSGHHPRCCLLSPNRFAPPQVDQDMSFKLIDTLSPGLCAACLLISHPL